MYFLPDVEKFEQNSISRRSMLKSLRIFNTEILICGIFSQVKK